MLSGLKLVLISLVGASILCPLCLQEIGTVGAASSMRRAAADTATVRLHISRMTCGTCPATARIALTRLAGVYSATVTLEDSLGVVWYDPARVSPDQIAAHLTKLTGFGARILSDTSKTLARPPGR